MIHSTSFNFIVSVFRYSNPKLDGILQYLSTSLDPKSTKLADAARYGVFSKDIGKCEARYKCSVDLEIIKAVI